MLDKAIKMNIKICEKHAFKCFVCFVVAFVSLAILPIPVLTIPALVVAVVYTVLIYHDLFDRSLFSEEAYTYMVIPISMRDMILGKVITACLYMITAFVVIMVTLAVLLIMSGEVDLGNLGISFMQIGSGVFDAVEDGKITAGEIEYDRQALLGVAVSFVMVPVKNIAFYILYCGIFLMGAIVRHLLDPQRNSTITTIGVVFGTIVASLALLAVMAVMIYLTSGEAETIIRTVILIVVPAVCGIALLAGSIKILERKYSLC